MIGSEPSVHFEIVSASAGYRVRMTRPNGYIQYIGGFETKSEASSWIATKGAGWFRSTEEAFDGFERSPFLVGGRRGTKLVMLKRAGLARVPLGSNQFSIRRRCHETTLPRSASIVYRPSVSGRSQGSRLEMRRQLLGRRDPHMISKFP